MQEQQFNDLPNEIKSLFDVEEKRAGDLPPDEKLVMLKARKAAVAAMMRKAVSGKRYRGPFAGKKGSR